MDFNIGKRIRSLRAERKASQKDIAEYLGVLPQTVSKWERGECSPDISVLPDIALFFGISIDGLFLEIKEENEEESYAHIKKLYDNNKWEETAKAALNCMRKFPRSHKICEILLISIAQAVTCNIRISNKMQIQAINIAKRIIDECNDTSANQAIIYHLCVILYRQNRTEEADFYYSYLNSALYSRESLDSYRYTGKKLIAKLEENSLIWYNMLALSFSKIAYSMNASEESISYLRSAFDFFKLSNNLHMAILTLMDISVSYAMMKNETAAYSSLDEAHKFAIDNGMEEKFIITVQKAINEPHFSSEAKKIYLTKGINDGR